VQWGGAFWGLGGRFWGGGGGGVRVNGFFGGGFEGRGGRLWLFGPPVFRLIAGAIRAGGL